MKNFIKIRARPTAVLFFMQQNNIFCKERKVREMKKMTNNVIDTYNAVTGSIVARTELHFRRALDFIRCFSCSKHCRLVNRWMKASIAGKETQELVGEAYSRN